MKTLLLKHGPFALCCLPLFVIIAVLGTGGGGPDPADWLMHVTGEWAARILLLCLLMSPLRRWTRNAYWLRIRRTLGLFAFFYACLHLLVFLQIFTGWSATRVLEELAERSYITAGFAAWLAMLPLAWTSTRRWQRKLGPDWARLHRLVYLAALAVPLHIFWQARSDIGEALVYSALFAGLLAWRISRYFSRFQK